MLVARGKKKREHTSVATNIILSRQAYFCRDKRRVLSQQARVCRDKHMFYRDTTFVATKMILVAAPANHSTPFSSRPSKENVCFVFVVVVFVFNVSKDILLLRLAFKKRSGTQQ